MTPGEDTRADGKSPLANSLHVGLAWFIYCLLHCWLEGTLSQAPDTHAFGKRKIRAPFWRVIWQIWPMIFHLFFLIFLFNKVKNLHLHCHRFWCEQEAFLNTLHGLVVALPGGHEFLGRRDVVVFFLSHHTFRPFFSGDGLDEIDWIGSLRTVVTLVMLCKFISNSLWED